MKKLILAIATLCVAGSISLRAADSATTKPEAADKQTARPARHLTEDQKKLLAEMKEKYDTNKDGKLDRDERAKISADDKERMSKAGLSRGPGGKGRAKKKD